MAAPPSQPAPGQTGSSHLGGGSLTGGRARGTCGGSRRKRAGRAWGVPAADPRGTNRPGPGPRLLAGSSIRPRQSRARRHCAHARALAAGGRGPEPHLQCIRERRSKQSLESNDMGTCTFSRTGTGRPYLASPLHTHLHRPAGDTSGRRTPRDRQRCCACSRMAAGPGA